MNRMQLTSAARRSGFWQNTVYAFTAVAIMLLLFGVGRMATPQIRLAADSFRDPAKQVEDDGNYGMMIGLLLGVCFLLPSMLLPLLPAIWIDRKLGIACPECGASLTLWKRRHRVLQSGRCCCCQAHLLGAVPDPSMDEPADALETPIQSEL